MSDDILSNWQQYRHELVEHTRLTDEEEQVLVNRALQGDEQAKHEIVQACLWYVARIAYKEYLDLPHDDLLDLVAEGNLALVEHVDRSLSKPNPFAYLMKVAAMEIKHYIWYRSHLIRRTDDRYPIIPVKSMDAPINANSATTLADFLAMQPEQNEPEVEDQNAYDDLYQAIEQLTEKQQYVVKRHFGMDGFGPEPLGDISRRLSPSPAASLASVTLQAALRRLRVYLKE